MDDLGGMALQGVIGRATPGGPEGGAPPVGTGQSYPGATGGQGEKYGLQPYPVQGQSSNQFGNVGGAGQGGPGGWHPEAAPVGAAPNTAGWDAVRANQAGGLQASAEMKQQQDSAQAMKNAYGAGNSGFFGR